MTRQDADRVLDCVREGEAMPSSLVDRALSAQEVLDNFNAIRGRYGV